MNSFIVESPKPICKEKKSNTNLYIIITIVVCFIILILIVVFFVIIPFNNIKKKADELIVPAKNLIDKTNKTEDEIMRVVKKAENIENVLIKIYPAIKEFICPLYPDLVICK